MRAAGIAPQMPDTIRTVIDALNRSDIARATEIAREALAQGEIHPLFLNLRAFWLEARGRDREALADLQRAHALEPEDAPASNALGLLLTKLDRTAEAVKAYDAAIASQPKFAAAHFNKGFALEALGELDKAREAYESAVTLDATPAEPFARLASLAVRRGDYIELQRNAAQALSRNPNEPITNLALAVAELEKGALPQAEERIVRLKQSGLSDVDSYFASGLLGDVRDRQGHFDDAFRFYVEGNTEFRRARD